MKTQSFLQLVLQMLILQILTAFNSHEKLILEVKELLELWQRLTWWMREQMLLKW